MLKTATYDIAAQNISIEVHLEFNDIKPMLDRFIKFTVEFYDKRCDNEMKAELSSEIDALKSFDPAFSQESFDAFMTSMSDGFERKLDRRICINHIINECLVEFMYKKFIFLFGVLELNFAFFEEFRRESSVEPSGYRHIC
jgi:hypothetical protein